VQSRSVDVDVVNTALPAPAMRRRYTRKKISQKVRLRLTPEIRFILDDSYQRATKVRRAAGARAKLLGRVWF
jgi:ribosome-binding factor A